MKYRLTLTLEPLEPAEAAAAVVEVEMSEEEIKSGYEVAGKRFLYPAFMAARERLFPVMLKPPNLAHIHTRRGSARVKHAGRLAWLRAHPAAMDGVPSDKQDVDDAGRTRLEALRARMDGAGLMGRSTNLESQRGTIRRLVGELRGEVTAVTW